MKMNNPRTCSGLWVAVIGFACSLSGSVILETDTLRIEVLPESSGRITSLYDKRSELEHIEPLREETDFFSPLVPAFIQSNQAGFKDWFWGRRIAPKIPFVVDDYSYSADSPWVRLSGEVDGVEITRTITLDRDTDSVLVEVRLSSQVERTVSYWAHLVLNHLHYLDPETGEGIVAGRFLAGAGHRQGRALVRLESSGQQTFATRIGDYAFATQEALFTRMRPKGGEGLTLTADPLFLSGEGFFYTWQNAGTVTLEAVWPPVKLSPGYPVTLMFSFSPEGETTPSIQPQ